MVKHLEEDDEQKVLGDSSCILGFATGKKKSKVSLWVKNYLQGRCMEFLYNRLKYLNMLKKSQNSDLQRRRSRQERQTRRRSAKLLM